MDKNFQRVQKKAERIFAALDKGDKSPRRYAQLAAATWATPIPKKDQKKDQSTVN